MKTLLIKDDNFLCDECNAGIPAIKKLPCQVLLSCQYVRSKGLSADFLLPDNKPYKLDGYDIVCAWVPLLDGFYKGIEYLKRAKKEGKRTVMILNDPFETTELEAMQKYDFIDFVIRLYEREYTLGLLLEELNRDPKKKDFTHIEGLIFRLDGKIIDTGKKKPFSDLSHLPSTAPLLESIDLSRYKEVYIEAGRGCPFSCTFCFYSGTKPRKRRIDDLISELKVIQGKVPHIWLHDLNMLVNEKWTNELCDKIIENNIKADWGTDARLDECANLELLKKMRKAGCYLLAFGLESADEEVLKKINKKINLNFLKDAIKNCKAAGIFPEVNIMYGFPWDTEESFKKAEEVLRNIPVSTISIVRPLRGTRLYDDYKKMGLLDKELGIEDYVYMRNNPITDLPNITRNEVIKWHKKYEVLASRNFFRKKVYQKGYIKTILEFVETKRSKLFNIKKILAHIFTR